MARSTGDGGGYTPRPPVRLRATAGVSARPRASTATRMNNAAYNFSSYLTSRPKATAYSSPTSSYKRLPNPYVNQAGNDNRQARSGASITAWDYAQWKNRPKLPTTAQIYAIMNKDRSGKSMPTPTAEEYYDSGGGGGGGGGGYYDYDGGGGEPPAPPEITWSEFDGGVANKPDWWKALKPSEMNADTEYLSTLNLLIPFLSPEDQKTVASTIYQMDAKNFGHLNPEKIVVNPEDAPLSDSTRQEFTSAERARRALAAMTSLAAAVGKKDSELGPGYRYLRSIMDVADKYGTTDATNRQTRTQYQQMLAALDPLLAESSGSSGVLAPYGSLVKMLSQPFFSMGKLRSLNKNASGGYTFGDPNAALL